MTNTPIRFDNGAAYERYMGAWSRLAGETFLDWLAPEVGWRWLDVGCGNGAFTEMLVHRCSPAVVHGIDPSEAQIAYARQRPALSAAKLGLGDAMALPHGDGSFDAAVMPLVLFFVPEPRRGVAEMARVVRPGGAVTAYAWDMLGGGFPYEAVKLELEALGLEVPLPPSPEASRIDVMVALWSQAGLTEVATRVIGVRRTYADFEDYWITVQGSPSAGATLAQLAAEQLERFKAGLRARLPADAAGRITCAARAHAVKGRVPVSA